MADKIATFQDPFNSNSTDPLRWTSVFGTLTYLTQQLTIANPANYTGYGGFQSLYAYDLTNSQVYIQVISYGNIALASWQVEPIELILDANNSLDLFVLGGKYVTRYQVAGTNTDSYTGVSAATYPWCRIREASGTVYYECCATLGGTWTTLTSVADPFTLTSLSIQIVAGTYSNEASATSAVLDNFNTPGNVPTNQFFKLV
jgi:hypothetical protein